MPGAAVVVVVADVEAAFMLAKRRCLENEFPHAVVGICFFDDRGELSGNHLPSPPRTVAATVRISHGPWQSRAVAVTDRGSHGPWLSRPEITFMFQEIFAKRGHMSRWSSGQQLPPCPQAAPGSNPIFFFSNLPCPATNLTLVPAPANGWGQVAVVGQVR